MGERSKKSDTTPAGVASHRLAVRREQLAWSFASLLTLIASTVFFISRAPYGDPYSPPPLLSLDRWVCPIEWNAPRRLVRVNQPLRDVFALPGTDKVWIAGDGGVIFHSKNGGKKWSLQDVPKIIRTSVPPLIRASRDEPNASELQSAVISRQPESQSSTQPDVPKLSAIHFLPDGETGWAVGFQVVLKTTDGGETWQEASLGSPLDGQFLTDVFFLDSQTGWITGSVGCLRTTDGGTNWIRDTSSDAASAVHFGTLKRGCLATTSGMYGSDEGGATFTLTLVPDDIRDVKLAGRFGCAVGRLSDFSSILLESPTNAIEQPAKGNGYPDPESPTARKSSDSQGVIAYTLQGDRQWRWLTAVHGSLEQDASRDVETLLGVEVLPSGSSWAVGRGGQILRSLGTLETWKFQESGTQVDLTSVSFRDESTGWVVGYRGTILHTSNGGTSWQRQSQNLDEDEIPDSASHWWIPGLGYYLALAACALMLVPVFRKTSQRPTGEVEPPTIAAPGISDRPLEFDDPDYLDFGPVALAISRFVRNEDTEPPITIAVTGGWGTGKSSLMNLVHADLERHSFRPVWFNAWHHQNEEQMLASLLENIRSQAIPSWNDPGTRLRFRARLLYRKAFQQLWLIAVFILLGVIANSIPVVNSAFMSAYEFVMNPSQSADAGVATGQQVAEQSVATSTGMNLVFWSGVIGVLAALWRGMASFGMNPASLIAEVSNASRISRVSEQLSFRHRFADEFRDVTWALKPRSLVIMIDDLDRCRPENVLEILEAINFLVTSGDCFVLCGMALNRVEPCIGLGFERVAQEMPLDVHDELDENGTPVGEQELTPEELARHRRRKYAKQYLEKLINIEIPVPRMTDEQSRNLLSGQEDNVQPKTKTQQSLSSLVLDRAKNPPPWLQWSFVGIALAVTAWTAYWLGTHRSSDTLPSEVSSTETNAANAQIPPPPELDVEVFPMPSNTDDTAPVVVPPPDGADADQDQESAKLFDWLRDELGSMNLTRDQQNQLRQRRERLQQLRFSSSPEDGPRGPAFRDAIVGSESDNRMWSALYLRIRDHSLSNVGAFDPSKDADWNEFLRDIVRAIDEYLDSIPVVSSTGTRDIIPAMSFDSLEYQPADTGIGLAWWLAIAALLTGSAALVFAATRTVEPVVRDSEEFKDALGIWHKVISKDCRTPRAFKRFVNRLRFSSMRIRPPVKDPTNWDVVKDQIRRWLASETEPVASSPNPLTGNEPQLVGLTSVMNLNSNWLLDEKLWRGLQSGLRSRSIPPGISSEEYKLLKATIAAHRERFGEWDPTDLIRDRLVSMLSEVHATSLRV